MSSFNKTALYETTQWKRYQSLRVVYILSEDIECVIDSALEVGRMEALSQRPPPAQIHQVTNVLVDTFQLGEGERNKEGRDCQHRDNKQ